MDTAEREQLFHEAQSRHGVPLYVVARQQGLSPATVYLWRRFGIAPKRHASREKLAALLGLPTSELEVQNAPE